MNDDQWSWSIGLAFPVTETEQSQSTMSPLVNQSLHSSSPHSSSPCPNRRACLFYKLMDVSIIQDKKLRIPNKFVRKFGDELSSVATLSVPSGRDWPVELRKAGQKLWFHDGWHEFVKHHCIHAGNLLIFRYEGNSNFDIYMFNLTACESCNIPSSSEEPNHVKQCPVSLGKVADNASIEILGAEEPSHGKHHPVLHGKEIEDDDSIEFLGSFPPRPTSMPWRNNVSDEHVDQQKPYKSCIRTALKNLMHSPDRDNMNLAKDADTLKAKVRSTREIGIQFNESDLTRTAGEVGSGYWDEARQSAKRRKQSTEPKFNVEVGIPGAKVSIAVAEKRGRAIRVALRFNPGNPFCRVVMKPSYIHKGYLLHIPSSFAQKYLNRPGSIVLQISDGPWWLVRCINGGNGAKLSQGWREFVLDNCLEEGDVCVFELINKEDIMLKLKVTIFRVLEDAGPGNQP